MSFASLNWKAWVGTLSPSWYCLLMMEGGVGFCIIDKICEARMLARPYLMTLYAIFLISLNFSVRSRCVLKAIIHRKKHWIVLQLLKDTLKAYHLRLFLLTSCCSRLWLWVGYLPILNLHVCSFIWGCW